MKKILLMLAAFSLGVSKLAFAGTSFPPGISSSAIGSTVAPLSGGVVPPGYLPAATTNTAGVMSLTTAGAQAPIQSVGSALTLTGTTVNLPTANTTGSGSYNNVTVDSYGRITSIRVFNSTDITGALGFTPYSALNPSGYVTSTGAVTAAWAGTGFGFTTAPTLSTLVSSLSGTTAGTLAAGNDSRITGALQTSAAGPLATEAGANANAAVIAALGFTPYNATNPNSYVAIGTTAGTARDAAAAITAETNNANNISTETTRAEAAEATKVATSAIGTTVAPLSSGVVPSTDLPAATSSVQGAMSLTTAGAQAPIQTVGTGLTLTGTQVTANIGTTSGTVASGNDTRITGALQTTGGTITGTLTINGILTLAKFEANTITTGITTAGTTLATATALTTSINSVSTCSTGGVALPALAPVGSVITILNRCGGSFPVYPDSTSNTIETNAAGVSVPVNSSSDTSFTRVSATQWMD